MAVQRCITRRYHARLVAVRRGVSGYRERCSASVLMDHHGRNARVHAAVLADAMLDHGALAGYGVWRRILRAVEELQRTAPKPGEAVH